jgi:hypothetical protein
VLCMHTLPLFLTPRTHYLVLKSFRFLCPHPLRVAYRRPFYDHVWRVLRAQTSYGRHLLVLRNWTTYRQRLLLNCDAETRHLHHYMADIAAKHRSGTHIITILLIIATTSHTHARFQSQQEE